MMIGSKQKFVPDERRRGWVNLNTPPEHSEELKMSDEEKLDFLKMQNERLIRKREDIYEHMGRPNKYNLKRCNQGKFNHHGDKRVEWLALGDAIYKNNQEITEIKKRLKKARSIESFFIDAAREILDKEAFAEILNHAKSMRVLKNDM